jgi:cyanophycinase
MLRVGREQRLIGDILVGVMLLWVSLQATLSHAQSATSAPSAVRDPWVDGIEGSLVLSEASVPGAESLEAFVRSAANLALQAKRPARGVLVIWPERSAGDEVAHRLTERWEKLPESQWTVLRLKLQSELDISALALLAAADGVWLQASSADELRSALDPARPLARVCADVRRRGGVLGGSAALVAVCNEYQWLPEFQFCAMDAPATKMLSLQLAAGTNLAVRGRELEVLGEGQVKVSWPAIGNWPAEESVVGGERRVADLTAWRRQARERARAPLPTDYPPAELVSPVVPRGTLIIIGGARTPAAAFKEFVLAAGGARASIVVLPISMPAPLPAQDGMAEALKRAGVTDVTVLDQRTPQAIDQPEPLAALRRATGIWFGGGRQWRFVDAYEGTEAERQMHAVLARGGVIAGSSAGATIQGDYLVRGHPLGPQYMICEGYPRGMGFLPGVAIDQHFTQRKRQPDLIGFLGRYPQFLGIGLDESTAIIVRGSKAQVVGEHQVHFYDPRQGVVDASRCSSLSAGGEYDLLMRKVVTSPLETATTK